MSTSLPSGIPAMNTYDAAVATDAYRLLEAFSADWIAENSGALTAYSAKWVTDPIQQWSRRWEYLYVASRFLDEEGLALDAGSGVTFFPQYLTKTNPHLTIVACDFDPENQTTFNRLSPTPNVSFAVENLLSLSFPSETFDSIYSISTLEHLSNPVAAVLELDRVLKPGGLFSLTFDLALGAEGEIPMVSAERLLQTLNRAFRPVEPSSALIQVPRRPLSARSFAYRQRERLPRGWDFTRAQAVKTFVKSRTLPKVPNVTVHCSAWRKPSLLVP